MSLTTSDIGVEGSAGGGVLWHRQLAVLLIEQGRELCNVMTELPAPVGDGLTHVHDPICPQDPGTVHVGQTWGELAWLLDATASLVEGLAHASVALAGNRPVAGLGPVVAIAARWVSAARGLLADGRGAASSDAVVAA